MNPGLDFEYTMRHVFGDKASHIADCGYDRKYRNPWLLKAIRQFIKDVDALDTTERHKQMLMNDLETSISHLKKDNLMSSWGALYMLLRVIARLLGYDFMSKTRTRCHTLCFWQDGDQRLTTALLSDDTEQFRSEERDAIAIRRQLIEELRNEGLAYYKIALVMNTTEYKIKKMLREALV